MEPSLRVLRRWRETWPRAPIWTEIEAPPPSDALARVHEIDPRAVLLESVQTGGRTGRYSVLGIGPAAAKFWSRDTRAWLRRDGRTVALDAAPVAAMQELLHERRAPDVAELPPFCGGAIGLLSYDLAHQFERLPAKACDDLGLPDIWLVCYDRCVVWDHAKQRALIIASVPLGDDLASTVARTQVELLALEEKLKPGPLAAGGTDHWFGPSSPENAATTLQRFGLGRAVEANMPQNAFCQAVRSAKAYIAGGDIFQVNLAQRLTFPLEASPLALYGALRAANPAPFAAFVPFPGGTVVSSSPERLIRVRGRRVETRPIAGTRPRGLTPLADISLAEELFLSPKECAEHLMLVDLERNDLGRVAEYGSVRVDELMVHEPYARVHHIVSNVTGELRADCDRADVLVATFPGGTITGCPKIRAMEIIDELESTRRGFYTGSAGYFSDSGAMDWNILIRTFVCAGERSHVHVGAGIVADSEPEREYEETLTKAAALLDAAAMGSTPIEKLASGVP